MENFLDTVVDLESMYHSLFLILRYFQEGFQVGTHHDLQEELAAVSIAASTESHQRASQLGHILGYAESLLFLHDLHPSFFAENLLSTARSLTILCQQVAADNSELTHPAEIDGNNVESGSKCVSKEFDF